MTNNKGVIYSLLIIVASCYFEVVVTLQNDLIHSLILVPPLNLIAIAFIYCHRKYVNVLDSQRSLFSAGLLGGASLGSSL